MLDDYCEEVSAFGKITNQDGESCDVFINLKYYKYLPDQIECQVSSAQEEKLRFLKLFGAAKPRLEIYGFLESKQKVHIENIHGYSLEGNIADLNIESFSLRYTERIPFDSGYAFIEVSIPEAPSIEVPICICLGYLGEIENKRKDEDAVCWENEFGEFAIADFYKYEKGRVGIGEAIYRIKVYQIRIKKKFDHSFFIEELIPEIERELEDILWLLSFINRRRIFWYEISIDIVPIDSAKEMIWIPKFIKRRKIFLPKETKWKDCLIAQPDLAKGGLYRLLEEYKKSSMKAELRRAIIYTIASYERDTIEAQIQSIYLALEVLVNTLSENYNIHDIIPRVSFRALSKQLKETILRFLSNEKIEDNNKKSQLIKNISRLNKIPFADRSYSLIKELKIEVLDFLKEPDELRPKLEEIQTRRNRLIHKGEVKEIDKLYEDLVILRAISERMILKLLNWPLDKTFASAFRSLHSFRD